MLPPEAHQKLEKVFTPEQVDALMDYFTDYFTQNRHRNSVPKEKQLLEARQKFEKVFLQEQVDVLLYCFTNFSE